MRRSVHMLAAALSVCAMLAVSCSDGGSETTQPSSSVPANVDTTTTDAPPSTVVLPDYGSQAADLPDAPDDRSLPPVTPAQSIGAYGFSRYVFNQVGDDVLATLIEGPRGYQYRCQGVDQECSYLELKALAESGDPVPEYLGMSGDELAALVSQLDEVNAAVEEYPTLEQACAAGFSVSSSQNANMGIHVNNPNGSTVAFDPSRPQMVLYAKDGGERLTREELGSCVDGEWTGDPGYESVGAVFTLLLTEDHPDAFAGPIDNWHIHFNTCAGSRNEGGADSAEDTAVEADGTRGAFSREQCEADGGAFQEVIPVWMMHAYVDPDHDAQGGVFAMFNPSLPPVIDDPAEIERLRTTPLPNGINASINNFDFGELTVEAGQPLVFSNSDSVPHTVTAGAPGEPLADFDSGLLGTGDSYELTFDDPGEYALFCVLHPAMTATVTVE